MNITQHHVKRTMPSKVAKPALRFGSGIANAALRWLVPAGLAGAAALVAIDRYQNGYQAKVDLKKGQAHTDKIKKDMQIGWGEYTGSGMFDQVKRDIDRGNLYGPFDMFTTFKDWGIMAETFVSQVLAPASIPIFLTIGSLYAAFGKKAVHRPFNWLYRNFIRPPFAKLFAMKTGKGGKSLLDRAGGKLGKLIMRGLNWFMKLSTRSKLLLVLVGGLAGFFQHQTNRTLDHSEQDKFFRDLVTKPNQPL